jgi:hypothetical protein
LLAYSTDLKEAKRVSCTSRFSDVATLWITTGFEMDGSSWGADDQTLYLKMDAAPSPSTHASQNR